MLLYMHPAPRGLINLFIRVFLFCLSCHIVVLYARDCSFVDA